MSSPWFLERFHRVTGHDDRGYRATCTHCGSHRALEFLPGDRAWILKTYCGCPKREVLEIAEIGFSDLLYENESRPRHTSSSSKRGAGENTYAGPDVDRRSIESRSESQSEVEQLLELHAHGRLGGVIEPVKYALPGDATGPMERVAEFFALVAALREWAGMPREVLFSSHWAAAKLGLPQKTVWRALDALVKAGVLAAAGKLHGRGGKRSPRCYVPGELAGSDHQRGDLVVAEAAVERDSPHVELGALEEAAEPLEVVPVLEAAVAVRGGRASAGGALPLAATDGEPAPDGGVLVHLDRDRRVRSRRNLAVARTLDGTRGVGS